MSRKDHSSQLLLVATFSLWLIACILIFRVAVEIEEVLTLQKRKSNFVHLLESLFCVSEMLSNLIQKAAFQFQGTNSQTNVMKFVYV